MFNTNTISSFALGYGLAVSSLVPLASHAADTMPTSLPEPIAATATATATKLDRLAAAREAINAKDWPKSIALLSAQAKEKPGHADTYNLLAYSLRKQAKPDLPQAFDYYRMALKADPKHKGANEYIGEAYLMDKKPGKAEEHLAALKAICGSASCVEYQELAKSIAAYKGKN